MGSKKIGYQEERVHQWLRRVVSRATPSRKWVLFTYWMDKTTFTKKTPNITNRRAIIPYLPYHQIISYCNAWDYKADSEEECIWCLFHRLIFSKFYGVSSGKLINNE